MFSNSPVERFSFNFALDGDEITPTSESSNEARIDEPMMEENANLIPAREHFIEDFIGNKIGEGEILNFNSRLKFKKICLSLLPSSLQPVVNHSDVVKHVYEGGLKLWECCRDLLEYLDENFESLDQKNVLDLGCGQGFLGIYSLMVGNSDRVTFQDLNFEVLEHLTMKNVLLNVTGENISRAKFVSGAWNHRNIFSLLPPNSFSLILTSDTLYEPTSLEPLLKIISHCLAPHGLALIAAKRYYFGIGGGTEALKIRVDSLGLMEWKVEKIFEDGKSNIREIVTLKWKNNKFPQ